MYNSQWKQDQWLNENIFKNMSNGVFVDVGAHDGITVNNTYFFESHLGWSGLCIEPIPEIYDQLKYNRSATCIHGCAYNRNGTVQFQRMNGYTEMLSGIVNTYHPKHIRRIDNELTRYGGSKSIIDVPCYTLDKLFADNNINHVDYLSIDTEGSELQILEGINFDNVTIDVIEIEINYKEQEHDFTNFLVRKGYKLVKIVGGDYIYAR